MTPEEQVIRDWLAGQLSESGGPLPPDRRRSLPLPPRRVVAVVATLVGLLDEERAVHEAADAVAQWSSSEGKDGMCRVPGNRIAALHRALGGVS